MDVKTYDQTGKEVGQTRLSSEIFGVKVSPDLVHQVAVLQMGNRRRIIAKAKDRSEVRGGGRKPWRQKGTGRARHGSRRSPIWRGGGVTFGPTGQEVFKKKINKKIRKKALFMVLSAKAKEKLMIILDNLNLESPKTKIMAGIINKLIPGKTSALFVLAQKDDKVFRAGRNISGLKIVEARNLNALDLLTFKYVILTKEAVSEIKKTFWK